MPCLPLQLGHRDLVPLLLSGASVENPLAGAPSSIEKRQELFPYLVIDCPPASYALQSVLLIGSCF